MNGLKPCPFCGQEDLTVEVTKNNECWIECPNCGVETPLYESTKQAVAAWNRRVSNSTNNVLEGD